MSLCVSTLGIMADVPPAELPSASSSTTPPCVICSQRAAIYTCPRCATRTCSLTCSTAHKANTGCSGLRHKAKYVPINEYGLGTLMDDYVYLEEMGRKVAEWGKEIVRGGYGAGQARGRARGGAMGARGGFRGRGRGRGGGGGQRTKRDVLMMQLELRDVDVDMLPPGMARRTLNQSTWDFKNKTALLTMEIRFHPPPNPMADPSHPQDPPYTLLTHRNDFNIPLLFLVQSQIRERTKAKRDRSFPSWLEPLVLPDQDVPDCFTPPQFFMPTSLDPLMTPALTSQHAKVGYYKLDATQKLSSLLRQKHFVEFPTIDVWEEGAFRGVVVDAQGGLTREGEVRAVKRRRLDVKAAKKAMNGLLGGYGSDGDEEESTSLTVLGGYVESDGDEDGDALDEVEGEDDALGLGEDAQEYAGDGDSDEEVGPVDYVALLDIIQQTTAQGDDGDDEIDWGDPEDEASAGAPDHGS
ncbi:hypothetical protein EW146_g1170 [Bondarzewia mesenterica]|uniref:HIT-type domain-containing protein n=1 Tax=Bondarzewia mesenterica TaxID=1095465 RepID=A0A4S4M6K8_9AGAM|nr:hypothetical protein EW146_g1170 [Bondarzewia mesenterica]